MDNTFEAWLASRYMDRHIAVLEEANYKSLDSLRQASDSDVHSIIKLFDKPGLRLKMRLLLADLRATPAAPPVPVVPPGASVPPPLPPVPLDGMKPPPLGDSDSDSDEDETSARSVPQQPPPPPLDAYSSSDSDSDSDESAKPASRLSKRRSEPEPEPEPDSESDSDDEDMQLPGAPSANQAASKPLVPDEEPASVGAPAKAVSSPAPAGNTRALIAGMAGRIPMGMMAPGPKGPKGAAGSGSAGGEVEPLPATKALGGASKTGALEKLEVGAAWKPRWAILKADRFYWLSAADDEQPTGVIVLTGPEVRVRPSGASIEIATAGKTYAFRAETEAAMAAWVKAIEKAGAVKEKPATTAADKSKDKEEDKARAVALAAAREAAGAQERKSKDREREREEGRAREEQELKRKEKEERAKEKERLKQEKEQEKERAKVAEKSEKEKAKAEKAKRKAAAAEPAPAPAPAPVAKRPARRLEPWEDGYEEQQAAEAGESPSGSSKPAAAAAAAATGSAAGSTRRKIREPDSSDDDERQRQRQRQHKGKDRSDKARERKSVRAKDSSDEEESSGEDNDYDSDAEVVHKTPKSEAKRLARAREREKELTKMRPMLTEGMLFLKYKRKAGKKRLIWLPPTLDRIFWGGDKSRPKGDILVTDISAIEAGCLGAKKPAHAFTIVTAQRTLELEAADAPTKDSWLQALERLIELK